MTTSPERLPSYLAWVRGQPCCICGSREQVHAHHHGRREGGGGMGVKTCDLHTVPLCWKCHGDWHAHGNIDHASTRLPVRKRGGRQNDPHTFVSRELTQALLWRAIAILLRRAILEGVLQLPVEAHAQDAK